MKNNNLPMKPTIDKDSFIDFLASATPEEINKYIIEKGKPRKIVSPMYFYPREGEEQPKKWNS